jgi:hypothetical protein
MLTRQLVPWLFWHMLGLNGVKELEQIKIMIPIIKEDITGVKIRKSTLYKTFKDLRRASCILEDMGLSQAMEKSLDAASELQDYCKHNRGFDIESGENK